MLRTGYAHRLVRRIVVFSVLAMRTNSSTSQAFLFQSPTTTATSTIRTMSQRHFSTSSGNNQAAGGVIRHVGIAEMQQILRDYEEDGREDSKLCVIDVRGHDEVAYTGKLSENVYTLPVQVIMQNKVFEMDPEDFEEVCGFAKPDFDETLVFSCAAGVRSVYACQFAAKAGYSKLVNYAGGANEWFSYRN